MWGMERERGLIQRDTAERAQTDLSCIHISIPGTLVWDDPILGQVRDKWQPYYGSCVEPPALPVPSLICARGQCLTHHTFATAL